MNQKLDILTEFLSRLYHEIHDIESAHHLVASTTDLRPPIEHYHDAVREYLNHGEDASARGRLSVEQISDDIASMRHRITLFAEGAHTFYQGDADAKEVRVFKRRIIRLGGDNIHVPIEILREDLSDFSHFILQEDGQPDLPRLGKELSSRQAEKYVAWPIGAHWKALGAAEFWKDLTYTLERYRTAADPAASTDTIHLPDQRGETKQNLLPAEDATTYHRIHSALTSLWVQMTAPACLLHCFHTADDTQPPVFDEDHYIPELTWQTDAVESQRLSTAYARYVVMYAALLAETVDHNYKDLLSDLEDLVQDAYQLEQLIEEMDRQQEEPQLDMEELKRMLQYIDNPELTEAILALLMEEERRKQLASEEAIHAAQQIQSSTNKEIEKLEKQHFAFCASRLALYEQSQDIVKGLAAQGLNIAGQFTQVATDRAAARERDTQGRGR